MRGRLLKPWGTSGIAALMAGGGGGGGVTPVTFNPADANPDLVFSNGNYDIEHTGGGDDFHASARGTLGRSTGAWYFEVHAVETEAAEDGVLFGLADATTAAGLGMVFVGGYANSIGARGNFAVANGTITLDGSAPGSVDPDGTVFGVAVDLSNGHIWFARGNTWFGGITPVVASSSGRTGHFTPPLTLFPAGSCWPAVSKARLRTVAADLTHTPPSGFTAWAGG